MVSPESMNTIKTTLHKQKLPYSSPKNQVHVYGYHVSSAITMQYMNMIINVHVVHGRVKLGDMLVSNASHTLSLLSGDTVLTFTPGNFSKHVIHLETSRAAR